MKTGWMHMKGMGCLGLVMIRGLRQEMGGRIHEHAWRLWNLSNEGNDGNTFVRIWIFSRGVYGTRDQIIGLGGRPETTVL
jgi:hypothetical protein